MLSTSACLGEGGINQFEAIMQNKPNLRKAQMNVNTVTTKDYENDNHLQARTKQTQSNPISLRFVQDDSFEMVFNR